MAIFLLLLIVVLLIGGSMFFGAVGIVVALFAAVLVLVYFTGVTAQGFLIGFVVAIIWGAADTVKATKCTSHTQIFAGFPYDAV
ncbi:hypothetical protein [Mesorhizobium sp. M0058]|uniref:hypothetical protein n=1 Tax=Mesorhizobium sp. M0058 TaxID=2956865 RepID=UPI0033350A43